MCAPIFSMPCQILVRQFQHQFRREVQPHETVSPLPVNCHRDRVANFESMTLLQRVENLLPLLPRLDNSLPANRAVVAFLSA